MCWWLPWYAKASWEVALGVALTVWVCAATVSGVIRRTHGRWESLRNQTRSYYGMVIAHLGVCLWVLFLDGAEWLANSWFTGALFIPGMDAREVRIAAVLSLFWVPVAYWA